MPLGYTKGVISQVAFENHKELNECEIYICGSPRMVDATKINALKLGATEKSIHSDPFEFNAKSKSKVENEEEYKDKEEKFTYPKPNIKMWEALHNGDLLTDILTDFYNKVYEDVVLSPYFSKVEKRESGEYSSLIG